MGTNVMSMGVSEAMVRYHGICGHRKIPGNGSPVSVVATCIMERSSKGFNTPVALLTKSAVWKDKCAKLTLYWAQRHFFLL
eukprot:4592801-Amphidinium_carterae.1